MYFEQVQNTISKTLDEYIQTLKKVSAKDLGLDSRAGHSLYIDENNRDIIAVSKSFDSQLQYYGGFEYIDSDNRTEINNWIFYKSDNHRVEECFHYYYNGEYSL